MIYNDNEMCVLCCAISHGKSLEICEQLNEKDFQDRTALIIFKKIELLYKAGIPIDIESMMDDAIDPQDLSKTINRVPTGANYQFYIGKMLEKSRIIQLMQIGEDVIIKAKGGKDSLDIINITQSNINHLIYDKDGFSDSNKLIDKTIGNTEIPITTGFYGFDEKYNGFYPSDLIIIGARPSMGKTALAMSIILNQIKQGNKVGFFSLEMSLKQIGQRIISMHSEIAHICIKADNVQDRDMPTYKTALSELRELPIIVNDHGGLNVMEIKTQARQLYNEGKLDILFIDYLQLIYDINSKSKREREVTIITQELKNLAKELHIPVVLLSQLNRQTESRADNKPKLSDLRESGSIEQIADMVIFLYRKFYYTQDPFDSAENYMLIEKNRNGPTGMAQITFDSDIVKFGDVQ